MFGTRGDSYQDLIQLILLLIAVVCIPLMLFPKPLIIISNHKKVKAAKSAPKN